MAKAFTISKKDVEKLFNAIEEMLDISYEVQEGIDGFELALQFDKRKTEVEERLNLLKETIGYDIKTYKVSAEVYVDAKDFKEAISESKSKLYHEIHSGSCIKVQQCEE